MPAASRRWNVLTGAAIYLLVLGAVIAARGSSVLDLPGAVVGIGGVAYGVWRGLHPQLIRVSSEGVLILQGSSRRWVEWTDVASVDVISEQELDEVPRQYPRLRVKDGDDVDLDWAATRDLDDAASRGGELLRRLREAWEAAHGDGGTVSAADDDSGDR